MGTEETKQNKTKKDEKDNERTIAIVFSFLFLTFLVFFFVPYFLCKELIIKLMNIILLSNLRTGVKTNLIGNGKWAL